MESFRNLGARHFSEVCLSCLCLVGGSTDSQPPPALNARLSAIFGAHRIKIDPQSFATLGTFLPRQPEINNLELEGFSLRPTCG